MASSKTPPSQSRSYIAKLTIFAVLAALFSSLISYLNARLDQFYIFDPADLHKLSQRAIQAHGNDTAGVVDFIVNDLAERPTTTSYINREQEWMFNNAGGAMGAMYIIHASITEYLIIFGKVSPALLTYLPHLLTQFNLKPLNRHYNRY